jgi:hypothetical protein
MPSLVDILNTKILKVPNIDKLYKLENPVRLKSPFMKVAFRTEQVYNNLIVKVEFTDVNKNKTMTQFFNIISTLENTFYKKMCYLLNISPQDCQLKSQIYQSKKKYDPILTLKIPKKHKYVDAKILNSKRRTFYDLKRNDMIRANIIADIIWTDKKKCTMKWKIEELEFKDPDSDIEENEENNEQLEGQ